jgi:hypothetical protein
LRPLLLLLLLLLLLGVVCFSSDAVGRSSRLKAEP